VPTCHVSHSLDIPLQSSLQYIQYVVSYCDLQ
jgi:hypothetical protein